MGKKFVKMLLVEDNPRDARLFYEMFVDQTSYDVELAHVQTMAAAEKHLLVHAVDFIMLDLGLVDAQGLEALRRVRAAAPEVPLVVLTGMDDESLAVQALQEGAQDYLFKDHIDTHGLLRTVHLAIARKIMELEISSNVARLDCLSRHLVEARDRAEQANRAKSRFLTSMSHELRTPLNGILGYAHLLHMEGGLNVAQGARVDAMLEAGKHLLEMITCALDLSKIEAEHLVLQPAALDVWVTAETCLDLVRPGAAAKGLALSLAMAPGTSPNLVADPMRLRQILLNLLGNAVKFTSHGSIELRLQRVTDRCTLRIEVADTGPGIVPCQRERLFKEFERLGAEATSTVEGAGLGLALSARLAILMGGSLGHSDNPGGGSVFWLELPLDKAAAPSAPGAPVLNLAADATSRTPDRALHVLVADDALMNRDIASSFLRSVGHTVVCVDGGAEAVAAAAATDFDLVLMDVRMPGMDGLEATRHIRALAGDRGQVPIVALTAQVFTEQVALCRAAGMDGHLAKPFDPDALFAAVTRATSEQRNAGEPLTVQPAAATPRAAPSTTFIGSELPVINQTVFERTAGFLPPSTVASHLRTIVEIGETVLGRLRISDAFSLQDHELIAAAHRLAGSAGMLGFERLTAAGHRFERAVQTEAGDVPALGDALAAAVEATRLAIENIRPVGGAGTNRKGAGAQGNAVA